MITNDLQKRIHDGDREAFRSVYSEYGRGVYINALKTLGSEAEARKVVKQTFLNLHSELLRADREIDIPARIHELADNELLLQRILGGQPSAAAQERSAPYEEPAVPKATPAEPHESIPRYAKPQARREYVPLSDDDADKIAEEAGEPLPPLDRTQAYMRADGEADLRLREEEYAAKRSGRGHGFSRFLLVLFLLILLWVVAGIFMDLGFLPQLDLGYGWFNVHIFPLFTLGS